MQDSYKLQLLKCFVFAPFEDKQKFRGQIIQFILTNYCCAGLYAFIWQWNAWKWKKFIGMLAKCLFFSFFLAMKRKQQTGDQLVRTVKITVRIWSIHICFLLDHGVYLDGCSHTLSCLILYFSHILITCRDSQKYMNVTLYFWFRMKKLTELGRSAETLQEWTLPNPHVLVSCSIATISYYTLRPHPQDNLFLNSKLLCFPVYAWCSHNCSILEPT